MLQLPLFLEVGVNGPLELTYSFTLVKLMPICTFLSSNDVLNILIIIIMSTELVAESVRMLCTVDFKNG